MGTLVALNLAALVPTRVTSLGLIAGNPKFTRANDWKTGLQVDELDTFHANLKEDYQATLLRFLKLQTQGMASPRSVFKTLKNRLNECEPAHPKALAAGVDILKTADLRQSLGSLRIPLFVLLGSDDILVPVGAGHAIKSLYPAATVNILRGAGHIPFITHPVESITGVTRFLGYRKAVTI